MHRLFLNDRQLDTSRKVSAIYLWKFVVWGFMIFYFNKKIVTHLYQLPYFKRDTLYINPFFLFCSILRKLLSESSIPKLNSFRNNSEIIFFWKKVIYVNKFAIYCTIRILLGVLDTFFNLLDFKYKKIKVFKWNAHFIYIILLGGYKILLSMKCAYMSTF